MSNASRSIPSADLDQIYEQVRRDALEGISGSPKPTAVLVGGQPGAGRTYAAARVRAHLAKTAGESVVASGDDLRQYHPGWRATGAMDGATAAAARADVGRWYVKLIGEAVEQRVNLVLETSMRQAQPVLALTSQLKSAGYETAAVVLATDRDQSRQATMAAYDLACAVGLPPRFVSGASHESAYEGVRDSLKRIEADMAVDRIQVIVADGRQLYANEAHGRQWMRPPQAAHVLDDFRDRKRTPRELADSALRWETLVQRLTSDRSVPREVASQAVAWRNEATLAAEKNPEASRMLEWGRHAEVFRTMGRRQFLSEFPQYAKAVERMDEALRFAERNFEKAEDRGRFIAQARERLATRIAEGRFAAPEQAAERGGRSR